MRTRLPIGCILWSLLGLATILLWGYVVVKYLWPLALVVLIVAICYHFIPKKSDPDDDDC